MSAEAPDLETLLRQALAPVEPPADLAERLEATLVNLSELAADELESWELSSIRDPRNWVRPAAAVVVGTAAGGALILMRARRRRKRSGSAFDAAEKALREMADEARNIFRR